MASQERRGAGLLESGSMQLSGTASDTLPAVLATGSTDVQSIFVSLSARDPDGRDAEYLHWHSLDHRPEQYRVAGLRHSLRLVSTPACRAARAVSNAQYDRVDHVMTYFFAHGAAFDQFRALSVALTGDRRPFRLPSVDSGYFSLKGKSAASRAVAGADVIPWRPALGVYLIIETGAESAAALTGVPGVAGVWWHEGGQSPATDIPNNPGVQLTYCFMDDDPVATAQRLRPALEQRWSSRQLTPLLAAPFQVLVPFEWERYLP
jgi:hypothetical protein